MESEGFVFKANPNMKYLVVTGGSVSGIGKGTIISCIGVVLKFLGLRVTAIKIDPYLNVDAGTMSPYEHGEVFVLEDGGEVDLDLGNYERFLDVNLSRHHNITSGKIFEKVIRNERNGDYLGKTVQIVPHVVSCIESWIKKVASESLDQERTPPDICLIEVGGTVGDIESSFYLEALQQMSFKMDPDTFCFCHVSYIPCIVSGFIKQQKTKPAQHALKVLREGGLRPDFIFCRSEDPIVDEVKGKISLFGQVPLDHVIGLHNIANIYKVPIILMNQNFGLLVCKKLKIPVSSDVFTANNLIERSIDLNKQDYDLFCKQSLKISYNLSHWHFLVNRIDNLVNVIKIGIIGKYTGSSDSYLSVVKALFHAFTEINYKVEIVWIDSTSLTNEYEQSTDAWERLKSVDGIVCPGGFGDRGILGKMLAAEFCRKEKKPYLGICLGMQTAIIEFCKNVLGLQDADSEEWNPNCKDKILTLMPDFHSNDMGGTMRLGNQATVIKDKLSMAFKLYDQNQVIYERHRHRYEVNNKYVPLMESNGFKFVGHDVGGKRMEICELSDHPFFLCTQFHPEFTSKPMRPSPCFLGLALASVHKLQERFNMCNDRLIPGLVYSSLKFDQC